MTKPVIEQGEAGLAIGIDWGTSTARAFAFDRTGKLLAQTAGPFGEALGVQSLHARLGRTPSEADFAKALEIILQELWRSLYGNDGQFPQAVPILACGMIGSKQGIVDAGYLACPVDPARLARHLVVTSCGARTLHIVPGLRMDGDGVSALPDVMRGEETQILGALADGSDKERVMVLPGSHAKWARVRDAQPGDETAPIRIEMFETQFSGEMYAALSQHTILGRLFAADGQRLDQAAFAAGVDLARRAPEQMQRHLFSVRALGLS